MSDSDSVEAKIISLIEDVFHVTVTTTSRLDEDLNVDQLDLIEVCMLIEDEFEIELPDEQFPNHTWKTVNDIITSVKPFITE